MPPPLFPLPSETSSLNRRTFLAGSASFVAAALLSTRARGAVAAAPKFPAYPFSLGVASGDPLPDGVVLWTRLAPRPRQPGGGLAPEPIEVAWEIAEDEAMTRVVQRGAAVANPAWGHSVHVEVAGLQPARWYWYRFKAGAEVSPKGRTRTAPAAGATPDRLRFAFASCQNFGIGYYTAYEHMAREDLDLVVHLGDYIYEKGDSNGSVRPHGQKEIFTLDDYRERYAIYKSDPALQAMHAQAPWIVTWDDHEVNNDYAAEIAENPDKQPPAAFLKRRAAAYQAYFEHMPLRRPQLPRGPDLLLHRRVEFGRLASFHVLDTRQYRSDQLQPLLQPPSAAALDAQRTLLGDRQREWLFDGLARSGAAWNVLAQQVPVAPIDRKAGPGVEVSMEKWPGYEFERRRLLRHLHDRKVANPVVITGDVHAHWANDLLADFDRPGESRPVGVEFVGTSITSKGDGTEAAKDAARFRAENPFVKFYNDERGYVSCEVTPRAWRAHYRTVPYVSRRGAPLHTRASFAVESGRPVLQRA